MGIFPLRGFFKHLFQCLKRKLRSLLQSVWHSSVLLYFVFPCGFLLCFYSCEEFIPWQSIVSKCIHIYVIYEGPSITWTNVFVSLTFGITKTNFAWAYINHSPINSNWADFDDSTIYDVISIFWRHISSVCCKNRVAKCKRATHCNEKKVSEHDQEIPHILLINPRDTVRKSHRNL